MITQGGVLLVVLAIVVCTGGITVPTRAPLSLPARFTATTATTPEPHSRTGTSIFPTVNDAVATTEEPQPPVGTTSPPFAAKDVIVTTEERHPTIGTSPPSTTNDAITTTEEPHPLIHSSFFTTDATTDAIILKLPRNESVSRLLFWPPSAGINVTLNLTVSQRNYTFTVTTALPQHWHSIDIYQPNEGQNTTAMLYLHTEKRYLNFLYSRVVQVQVSSDQATHWCFCPSAHLCTLLSPLRDDNDSSGERTDLLAALLVIVFLLIVSLLALVGVTFHRKAELFHIYAKPIDCLPYSTPPPLPSPNKQPARHGNKTPEMVQAPDEKVAAKTEQTNDSGYSKVGGDSEYTATHSSPSAVEPAPDRLCEEKKHESINCLYGLI